MKMTDEEKRDFDELYNYVKSQVLCYDDNQSLSRTMVLRLKGLSTNKFIENNRTKSSANYSYKVILYTFKYCSLDIKVGLARNTFKDEMHKFNYILKIVESNINSVYLKLQNNQKSEEKIKEMDTSVFSQDKNKADYVRRTKDAPKKYDDFW